MVALAVVIRLERKLRHDESWGAAGPYVDPSIYLTIPITTDYYFIRYAHRLFKQLDKEILPCGKSYCSVL
jgi:hypothetical protein